MSQLKKVMSSFKEKIFKRPEPNKEFTRMEMLTSHQNAFFSYKGKLYHSDLVQSAIKPYARHIGKLAIKHVANNHDDVQQTFPSPGIRMLLEKPNDTMSMQMLLERCAWSLELSGNAFVYIQHEAGTYTRLQTVPTGLYHLDPIAVEALRDNDNELYLNFHFGNGTTQIIPYAHIIHLRNNFHSHDLFGDNPANALLPLLDTVATADQGIINAIKNSAVINWIIKFQQALRDDDVIKRVKEFKKNFMSVDSDLGGLVGVDAKYTLEQVKNENQLYIPDNPTLNSLNTRIFNLFQTNEKIINNTFNEDEFQAWHQSKIEPMAKQLTEQFTLKVFSDRERNHGNKIIFDTNSFAFASAKTKLNLIQLIDRSVISINEYRNILNLPPLEEDSFIIRREYGSLGDVVLNPMDDDGNPLRSEGGEEIEEN